MAMRRRSPAKYSDPIEQSIELALEPGYFIKYDASWDFVSNLETVEEVIAKLIGTAPSRARSSRSRTCV